MRTNLLIKELGTRQNPLVPIVSESPLGMSVSVNGNHNVDVNRALDAIHGVNKWPRDGKNHEKNLGQDFPG